MWVLLALDISQGLCKGYLWVHAHSCSVCLKAEPPHSWTEAQMGAEFCLSQLQDFVMGCWRQKMDVFGAVGVLATQCTPVYSVTVSYCYFHFVFFMEELLLAFFQTECKMGTKFILCVERVCWNIQSYWWVFVLIKMAEEPNPVPSLSLICELSKTIFFFLASSLGVWWWLTFQTLV